MKLQNYLDFFPGNTTQISSDIAYFEDENSIIFFNATMPIYSLNKNDTNARRVAAAMLSSLGLLKSSVISKVLKIHRNTVSRNKKIIKEKGLSKLVQEKSKRSPHKLTDEKIIETQKLLNSGLSIRKSALKLNIDEGTIRYALKKGRIIRFKKEEEKKESESTKEKERELESPDIRNKKDKECQNGIAVKRELDRSFAVTGMLQEASPVFNKVSTVENAGVLVALPALLNQGLINIGERVYRKLKNGFYGLKSVLIVLAFMSLLRIKNPYNLKRYAPGELGLLVGLDRFPEQKTLRRKIDEIGKIKLVNIFKGELLKYWTEMDKEAIGFLYIDGHVRAYHGKKYKIPKTHVARRRLCMPAVTDFWINDANAEPVFFFTASANDSLLKVINNILIPEIRKVVDKNKRITLVFDREGWSPRYFKEWMKIGFDIITYRKGRYDSWAESEFKEYKNVIGGKKIKYKLSEKDVMISKTYEMREVRRLCDDGHQTSIITNRKDLGIMEVAVRMFFRWRQENYFKYMREEYAIDSLITYDSEDADPERTVPNPEKKEKRKELNNIYRQYNGLLTNLGKELVEDTKDKKNDLNDISKKNKDIYEKVEEYKLLINQLKDEIKELPDRISIKTLMPTEDIVKLEEERKNFIDIIKIISYRAETELFSLLHQFHNESEDEGRNFLKMLFQKSANIIPDYESKKLNVELFCMSTPKEQEVLEKFLTKINNTKCIFPGTELMLCYKIL